jgi:hypothetical protein
MDPIERASALRQEADVVMREIGLLDILSRYGEITFSGSYFLDVMAYPDIDLYLSRVTVAQMFEIGRQLAESELVREVVFAKSKEPNLPGGLYLKPRIDYGEKPEGFSLKKPPAQSAGELHGDWGRLWKVDIWSLDDAIIEQQMRDMRRFKERMTPQLRERIVAYKVSVLTSAHRTPMYSGYFIYKAFFDEGMTDFARVTQYLVEQGIRME